MQHRGKTRNVKLILSVHHHRNWKPQKSTQTWEKSSQKILQWWQSALRWCKIFPRFIHMGINLSDYLTYLLNYHYHTHYSFTGMVTLLLRIATKQNITISGFQHNYFKLHICPFLHSVCFISNVYKQRLFRLVKIFQNLSNRTSQNFVAKQRIFWMVKTGF